MTILNVLRTGLALTSLMFVIVPTHGQSTWYVDCANCPGPGTGTEVDPFCNINQGISASSNGDTVILADCTYTGSRNRNVNFAGRLITLRSANGPENCIVDCELGGRGFIFNSGETDEVRVEGLTITNCTAEAGVGGRGGGMYITNSSPTIADCKFIQNSATGGSQAFTGEGGGIFCQGPLSTPIIVDCAFIGNTATAGTIDHTGIGGGIHIDANAAPTIKNSTFLGNQAIGGAFWQTGLAGGLSCFSCSSETTIENTTFVENEAIGGASPGTGEAGAMFVGSSSLTVSNCSFIGNKATGGALPTTGYAGGLWVNTASPKITNCIFVGNTAMGNWGNLSGNGGALTCGEDNSNPILTNCSFIGNTASRGGGAVWAVRGCDLELVNCTFAENAAVTGGGIYSTDEDPSGGGFHTETSVRNSVLWDNDPDQIVDFDGATTTVRHSDVQESWPGPGSYNIDADPLFLSGPSGSWTAGAVYNPQTSQTTFSDAAAGWAPGELVGQFLNPDTAQHLQSLIVANTETTVTTWADFAALGGIGTAYQINDYHIASGSPCIDIAENAAVPQDTGDLDDDGDEVEAIPVDLDLNWRFVDDSHTADCLPPAADCGEPPVVDMGAYEFPGKRDVVFEGDGVTLAWPPVLGAEQYNVYRGALLDLVDGDDDGLPDSGYGECVNHLDPDTSDTVVVDLDSPDLDAGFFYLVSFVDALGLEHDLGTTSAGLARWVLSPCP